MANISVTVRGDGIQKLEDAIKALGEKKARKAYRMAVNDAGAKTKTATGRALSKQTGLKIGVTRRALRPMRASDGNLSYKLEGQGGDISLKFFGPKETDDGVSASPFGKRQVFVGSFLSGGRWPGGRKGLIAGGHAFFRSGAARMPIANVQSGVVIPAEMVKGATADTFSKIGLAELRTRVDHHVRRMTKGVVT
jgi:hypothetical protein